MKIINVQGKKSSGPSICLCGTPFYTKSRGSILEVSFQRLFMTLGAWNVQGDITIVTETMKKGKLSDKLKKIYKSLQKSPKRVKELKQACRYWFEKDQKNINSWELESNLKNKII